MEAINVKIVLVNRKEVYPTTHFILDDKMLYSIVKKEDHVELNMGGITVSNYYLDVVLDTCISKILEAKPKKVVVFHNAKEPYENIVNLFLKYREKYKVKCKIYLDGIEIV